MKCKYNCTIEINAMYNNNSLRSRHSTSRMLLRQLYILYRSFVRLHCGLSCNGTHTLGHRIGTTLELEWELHRMENPRYYTYQPHPRIIISLTTQPSPRPPARPSITSFNRLSRKTPATIVDNSYKRCPTMNRVE